MWLDWGIAFARVLGIDIIKVVAIDNVTSKLNVVVLRQVRC